MMTTLLSDPRLPRPRTRFTVPADQHATRPPEAEGRGRDEVRLLVATPDGLRDRQFTHLPQVLRPGDLLVVNTSRAVPSAVDAHRSDGSPVVIHVAGPRPTGAGTWVIELRHPDGSGPVEDGRAGEVLTTSAGARIVLRRPADPTGARLWSATLRVPASERGSGVVDHLRRVGRPITYGHLDGRYDETAYETVFGRHWGSAEMPSAARPFTDALVTELVVRGVHLAPVLLHTGLSSPEAGEAPQPERYEVPPATAALADHVRGRGGRIVAVGTTVTRALETAAQADGSVQAGAGWTDLVLGPDRPARVVDGLLTGWHEPDASHLLLLEAVAGPALVGAAYDAAVATGHRWHEFGDACLFLPGRG
jgi:S-adenosylmethionine:tRNA ribosyltransferase-isomerase